MDAYVARRAQSIVIYKAECLFVCLFVSESVCLLPINLAGSNNNNNNNFISIALFSFRVCIVRVL